MRIRRITSLELSKAFEEVLAKRACIDVTLKHRLQRSRPAIDLLQVVPDLLIERHDTL